MARPFSDFREISCILLGAITGALIGLPWMTSISASLAGVMVVLSAVLGGFIGYRKRKSTLFFYLGLVSVVGLASLLSTHLYCCG